MILHFRMPILCSAAMLAIALPQMAMAERTLNIMNAGGEYGDSIEACVNKPFTEATGIKVVVETPAGFAKLQAQAKSGVITNASTDGSTSDMMRAVAGGLVEPIDWAKLNPESMFEEAKNANGFGASYWSTIMAWRSDAAAPQNWVDFFDTVKFPGKRALPLYADSVLAFAAMGGGQSMEDAAKGVDLDLAFATLERIKDDTIWWESGSQPAQLLKDNEAQYTIAWSGRIFGQEGVTASYNQGQLDINWQLVAKGISDDQRDMLYQWLKLQTNAQVQKCLVGYLPYPGSNPDLAALVTPEVLATFPTSEANKKVQFLVPAQWWLDNAAEVEKRWTEFRLSQ